MRDKRHASCECFGLPTPPQVNLRFPGGIADGGDAGRRTFLKTLSGVMAILALRGIPKGIADEDSEERICQ